MFEVILYTIEHLLNRCIRIREMMYIQSIFNHYILMEKRFNCIMVYKYFSDTITTQQTVRRFSAWNYIINNMQKYPCLQCMIYRGYKLNGFPVLFVTRRGYLIRFYTSISDPHLTKKGISTSKCVTNFYLYSAISLSVATLRSSFFSNLRTPLTCMSM